MLLRTYSKYRWAELGSVKRYLCGGHPESKFLRNFPSDPPVTPFMHEELLLHNLMGIELLLHINGAARVQKIVTLSLRDAWRILPYVQRIMRVQNPKRLACTTKDARRRTSRDRQAVDQLLIEPFFFEFQRPTYLDKINILSIECDLFISQRERSCLRVRIGANRISMV